MRRRPSNDAEILALATAIGARFKQLEERVAAQDEELDALRGALISIEETSKARLEALQHAIPAPRKRKNP